MEIGRSTNGSQLPKEKYAEPFGQITDTINLPFNVLWEQARSGITKMVHFSFKNLHQILGQAEMEIVPQTGDNLLPPSIPRSSMSLNSRIISASSDVAGRFSSPAVSKSTFAILRRSILVVLPIPCVLFGTQSNMHGPT